MLRSILLKWDNTRCGHRAMGCRGWPHVFQNVTALKNGGGVGQIGVVRGQWEIADRNSFRFTLQIEVFLDPPPSCFNGAMLKNFPENFSIFGATYQTFLTYFLIIVIFINKQMKIWKMVVDIQAKRQRRQ